MPSATVAKPQQRWKKSTVKAASGGYDFTLFGSCLDGFVIHGRLDVPPRFKGKLDTFQKYISSQTLDTPCQHSMSQQGWVSQQFRVTDLQINLANRLAPGLIVREKQMFCN